MKVLLLPPPTCLFLTAYLRDIVPEGMRVERSDERRKLFSLSLKRGWSFLIHPLSNLLLILPVYLHEPFFKNLKMLFRVIIEMVLIMKSKLQFNIGIFYEKCVTV